MAKVYVQKQGVDYGASFATLESFSVLLLAFARLVTKEWHVYSAYISTTILE